ncbi:MAG: hypothetical protein JWP45_2758 [Mucilaginibacter sp.]|nr:hypothetical protein [Mucilaginibacter sp.]
MLLLKITILIILLLLFIQDISSRSVYWFLFPVLIICLVIVRAQSQSLTELWQPVLINIGFVTLQLVILTLYFSFKNKRWVNITDQLLGIGDVLFLLSIAFYLSALNYLFFYITSLVAVLSFWLVFQSLTEKKSDHIPLAGLQGLIFGVFLAGEWWFGLFNLTNDIQLLHLITK